jgi:acyl-ACP thioesterase
MFRCQIREYPVRFTDIDLFDHMNNAVYWGVVEDYLSATPELLRGPLRVIIEHEAPVALGDMLEILAHVHRAGSTDLFGPALIDRTVTTLTYVVDLGRIAKGSAAQGDPFAILQVFAQGLCGIELRVTWLHTVSLSPA